METEARELKNNSLFETRENTSIEEVAEKIQSESYSDNQNSFEIKA